MGDQMCRNCGVPVATDLSAETRQTVETLCRQHDIHPAYTYCPDCYWGKVD